MFEFLLTSAVIIAVLMAFFYFRTGNSDTPRIVTKLENLNKQLFNEQEQNEFPCILKHVVDKEDQILVFLSSGGEANEKLFGAVPYEYKGRILHFMNTQNLRCDAVFNKSTEKLTIELIDELELKNS